jgi:hypothetical protein
VDDGAGALGGIDDLVRGAIQHFVIKRLHADADAFAHAGGQRKLLANSSPNGEMAKVVRT